MCDVWRIYGSLLVGTYRFEKQRADDMWRNDGDSVDNLWKIRVDLMERLWKVDEELVENLCELRGDLVEVSWIIYAGLMEKIVHIGKLSAWKFFKTTVLFFKTSGKVRRGKHMRICVYVYMEKHICVYMYICIYGKLYI